jgi:hypothetical protein
MISFVKQYHGWLGNMLFQYAATKALSLHRGTACGFPSNQVSRPMGSSLIFHAFALSAVPVAIYQPTYAEKAFTFDSHFWDLPDGTVLRGYFQSEKYFLPFADTIRDEFTRELHHTMDEPMVSVHVRRGDYLHLAEDHPPLTMDYYNAAMEHFPGAKFLIFSDDPGWCLLNFDRSRCEVSVGRKPEDDLTLMSDCQHHVIANSSFSWWGAWLGRNPEKKVIAPAKWFGPAKAGWDTKDLLPEAWDVI